MRNRALPLALFALLASGCGKPVDLKQTLHITNVTAGYHDAGVVEGRNKIAPSISFTLHKDTDDSLRPLSLNVAFKRLPPAGQAAAAGTPAEEDWEEVYVESVTFNGRDTSVLTIRPKVGYTGDPPQSRADMLKNSQFRDIRVHVFAKSGSSQWVAIGQFDLPRQLLVSP